MLPVGIEAATEGREGKVRKRGGRNQSMEKKQDHGWGGN